MKKHTVYIPLLLASLLILFIGTACKSYTIKAGLEKRARGEYFEAMQIFKKAVPKVKSKEKEAKTQAYCYLAESYYQLGQIELAENTYNQALRLKTDVPGLNMGIAKTKHRLGKYAETVKYYQLALAVDSNSFLAKNGLKAGQNAPEWLKRPTKHAVRMTSAPNSRFSEFAPNLSGSNNDLLISTTYSNKNKGKKKSTVTGQKYGDLLFSALDDQGRWSKPQYFKENINTEGDEGVVSVTDDGKRMFITYSPANAGGPSKIMVSNKNGGEWEKPIELKVFNDSTISVGHPAISPDGNTLFFVANTRDGFGENDIYKAKLTGIKVEEVENLGRKINSPGEEMFPYCRSEKEIYFSSNGWVGFGGLDIFRATLNEDNEWVVTNLGSPLNSPGDDFGISFAGLEDRGYFSSNRRQKNGYDMIYYFELPATKYFINGALFDEVSKPVKEANLHIVSDRGRNEKAKTDAKGQFKIKGEANTHYLIQVSSKDYLNTLAKVEFTDIDKDQIHNLKLTMIPIGRAIRVDNIFFDVDKADLRPESEEALQMLVKILTDNPNITIELSAHTDRKGSDEYNLNLSNLRAQSIVNYLVSKDIEADRLTPKGYGKSEPKVVDDDMADKQPFLKQGDILDDEYISKLPQNQQEIADQINRRTEFRVLKTNYKLY